MVSARNETSLDGVLWAETSQEQPVGDTGGAPKSDYDLAVVGGGFCGLSIALHASIQNMSVILLEAGAIGSGASGRNGGFTVPHFPGAMSPSVAEALLGRRRGERLSEIVADGAGFVFDQIRKYQIACDPEQNGWVQPAHSEKSLAKVRRVYEEWKAFGADVHWMDGAELAEKLGTPIYLGGWYGPSGGAVNPYALCQGLARAAVSQGAHVLQNWPVEAIERAGALHALRGGGMEVRARKVVIATNGYTPELYPGLSRSVVPLRMFHTFTRPLTGDEQAVVMPTRICFTDLRKAGGFCRYDRQGRVISGGAIFAAGNRRSIAEAHARHRFRTYFPQLEPPEFDAYWEGTCGVTPSFLPAVQVLDENVYSVIGFSTRGVALAQTLGREMAAYLSGSISRDDLPVEVGPVSQVPWQGVKARAVKYAFPVFKAIDRLGLT